MRQGVSALGNTLQDAMNAAASLASWCLPENPKLVEYWAEPCKLACDDGPFSAGFLPEQGNWPDLRQFLSGLLGYEPMRQVMEQQMELGQTPIDKIDIDVNSRGDIPATLLGLQNLYQNKSAFNEITGLLKTHILQDSSHDVGRPGLELWNVLVLGILKQSLNCGFDRLKELADRH